MEFKSVDYSIDTLLQRIRTSRLALPDFQREFVWKPNEVVELLDSVARQWPIGSLLLLSGPQPFATKEIESGPKVSITDLESYILDGQQRITSLYHAVMDVSEYCYYVNFFELDNESDEYIHWERRDRFIKQYPTVESRALNKVCLIKEIWDSQSFFRWMEHLENEEDKFRFVTIRDMQLAGLQTKVYKVMAIELNQEISLEALARIFETLNRTGVRLNAFDLMVAALYPIGFKLKEEWDSAINSNSIFSSIRPDAIEILKLCALRIRYNEGKEKSAGVRQGDLLRIDRKLIARYWKSSLELYVKSLIYCQNNFGVLNNELVPSWSMILGVAGLLEQGDILDINIHKWWKVRLLTQHYAQAANTKIVSDFEEFQVYPYEPQNIEDFEFTYAFMDYTKKNGLLAKGVAGLLIHEGAKDLLTGEPLDRNQRIAFREIGPTGVTSKINKTTLLLQTIVVTDETDRVLGKTAPIFESPFAHEALISQGIQMEQMLIDPNFLIRLFTAKSGENNA